LIWSVAFIIRFFSKRGKGKIVLFCTKIFIAAFCQGSCQENITLKYYEAGHKMHIHKPSLEQFTKDVAAFYTSRN